MAVKVAINGFGRIGRLAFRQMFESKTTNTAETVDCNFYICHNNIIPPKK